MSPLYYLKDTTIRTQKQFLSFEAYGMSQQNTQAKNIYGRRISC